jgi:hypothetical protein
MFKALGDAGLAKRVDHNCALIAYMASQVASLAYPHGGPRFLLVAPPSVANLCFYQVPPSMVLPAGSTLADVAAMDDSAPLLARLAAVAPVVKDRMQRQGRGLVGFQPVNGYVNCWRMVCAGAKEEILDEAGIDVLLADMVRFAADQ